MKSQAIQIYWHENSPIYSAHFETHGKGRLATAGGDNMVRIWQVISSKTGEIPAIKYLSTLARHTNAVNVVRFSPKGEHLASAGDDGNVLLWVPTEMKEASLVDHSDGNGPDKEHWRVKLMCRSSSGSEIYDIAWSPDGNYLITGSMDNVARIYDARDGQCVRQIAEHNHYVQGVAWDPLNEFVATQSSDRSLSVYNLKTKDGQLMVSNAQTSTKMAIPNLVKTRSSHSPVPDAKPSIASLLGESSAVASPTPSAPGTPTSSALPMRPPTITPSRRSSFNDSASNRGRSPSPMPGIPLPAVKPFGSPALPTGKSRTMNLFHDESLLTFFRRLTFTPDGSLLLAPAGQHKQGLDGLAKEEVVNTVYIYTRAGLSRPPVAHLPNQKKTAIAIKCSPVVYKLRTQEKSTIHAILEPPTDELVNLPPALEEPPGPSKPSADESSYSQATRQADSSHDAFKLPYRIVFAVATGDAVIIYDTQQSTPLAILSNLHYATFTDLAWSPDGHTLMMTSTDGFCSACVFDEEDLGQVYHNPPFPKVSKREEMVQKVDFPVPNPTRIPSPARSNSAASNTSSHPFATSASMIHGGTALSTPPDTAALTNSTSLPISSVMGVPVEIPGLHNKRASDSLEDAVNEPKKRRVQPTLVSSNKPC
ncbi:putative Chromatin assembly factor 1 subunit B [Taphrina deformans PYCC 5710]|uniref:Chromatin assembly factor 1 subunit B n=1 Tax=Taphrina deformans (strain PYCC 5710 / ATCC 11124 / CBS 356.35 / IMI 108563 / JCM 9778 / NBRC 8474) TaxID=1097556 RepID=R4X8T0_TAPDE|nr:putative Chromatin assembly factor 1 subunit B [Taphrina deformans PYCC 5710]|eukprot:CCG82053.1 putative Chromatin assembly factor 1 subunit B [Taphrina deformans PYCC 5710]